jgi:hypothetical protein
MTPLLPFTWCADEGADLHGIARCIVSSAMVGLRPVGAGDVRFGSKADIRACTGDVCFTPESGNGPPRL